MRFKEDGVVFLRSVDVLFVLVLLVRGDIGEIDRGKVLFNVIKNSIDTVRRKDSSLVL